MEISKIHVKSSKIRTVNLVVLHIDIATMCITTKFTVLIFAAFNV